MGRIGRPGAISYGTTLVAVGCVLAFGYVAFAIYREHAGQAIAYIDIEGVAGDQERRIVEEQLSRVDRERPDIERIRRDLAALDWIDGASVRRIWPGGLLVSVKRHHAIARWGEDAYLSEKGQIFSSPEQVVERLPKLTGPAGSERLVMEQYQQLSKAFQQSGQVIDDVRLGGRGDWILHLRSGIAVRLGKDDISDRLIRLLRVMQQADLLARSGQITEIDARYTNGVSVKWSDDLCVADCYQVANNENLKRVHTL